LPAVTTLSQALVAGGLSGARPLLVLLLLSLWARVTALDAVPDSLHWMVHPATLAALAGLALLEHWATVDADVRDLLKHPLAAIAVLAGLWTGRLVVALGWDAQTVHAGLTSYSAGLGALVEPKDAAVLVVSATAAGAVQWGKGKLLAALQDLALPGRWLRWLEAGGVAGTLAAVVLLPVLAVALAAVLLVGGAVAGVLGKQVVAAWDARARVACPKCGRKIRREASLCAGCKTEVAPVLRLDSLS
jgi:hypothetical protein